MESDTKDKEKAVDLEALADRIRDPNTGVSVQDRTYLLTNYPKELVDWFISHGVARTRPEAVEIGQKLFKENVFQHVTKDHQFKDEKLFYRFLSDQPATGYAQGDWQEFLPEYPGEKGDVVLPSRASNGFSTSEVSLAPQIDVQPLDEHNVRLLNAVHPRGWVDPTPEGTYNMVVIGAGAAGLVTAAGSAGVGARVAIIEKHLLGGDCLNVGCVPSKALLRCARSVLEIKHKAAELGVTVKGEVEVDFAKIMERMRRMRADLSPNDSAERFSKLLGVDVFIGHAQFISKDTVAVNGKKLKFSKACIATGGRAAVPKTAGLRDAGYQTNASIFNLTKLPPRLAIIGGGAIGCELAQAFALFGSKVTLIQRQERLMPREDLEASALVEKALRQAGVTLLLGYTLVKVEKRPEGSAIIVESKAKKQDEIIVDEILVSAGRLPNVEELGLEAAGVKYDKLKGVIVNDKLQTSNASIYAAGDVCSEYKFTHMADNMARIVIRNALFFGSAKVSALAVPWCTYTEPEVAHVGAYERDLVHAGVKFTKFSKQLSTNDRAFLESEAEGHVSVLVKEGTDKVLGATIVAAHAGEMISEVTLMMVAGVGLGTLATVIHPYPTQADAIRALGDEFNRTKLTPSVKILFRKLLSATK